MMPPLRTAGTLPVLEIVFLLRKVTTEKDRLIQFESLEGMPLQGESEAALGMGMGRQGLLGPRTWGACHTSHHTTPTQNILPDTRP